MIEGATTGDGKTISDGQAKTPKRGDTAVLETPPSTSKSLHENKENLRGDGDEDGGTEEREEVQDVKPEGAKVKHARAARQIFVECVYPRWKDLVQEKCDRQEKPKALVELHGNEKVETASEAGKKNEGDIRVKGEVDVCPRRTSTAKRLGLERFDCGRRQLPTPHTCAECDTTPRTCLHTHGP